MRMKEETARYFENSTALCRIPDIDAGFIPQGLDEASGQILITGYMGNGKTSPIYVVSRETGEAKKILMQTEEGKPFTGHAGGMSVQGGYVYIAGSTGGFVHAYDLERILAAEDGSAVGAVQKIALKNEEDAIRVSFTGADGTHLYAGEFHKDPIFYTHASHRVFTDHGTQKAYLFGFTLEDGEKALPALVYSIPDNVQGACFADGRLYLSQTDGLLRARILTYDLSKLSQSGTKRVLGKEIPLYILTVENAKKTTRIPPMSEEIIASDGQLHILYESASNRYRIGKKLGLSSVWSTPLTFFE